MDEHYTFTNLGELRDFLNAFKKTDLTTVLPKTADYLDLHYFEQTLTDGSKVIDFTITER